MNAPKYAAAIAVLVITVCLPTAALAADSGLGKLLADYGVTAKGYLSGTYTKGFNDGNTLAYRPFNKNSNSIRFNQALLTVAHLPHHGFGGLVTLMAGSDAPVVNKNYGNSSSAEFALVQGYLSYATGGFRIIGGRYVKLAGAEHINTAHDTNISRSFLLVFAEPHVETGVRARYTTGITTFHLGVSNQAHPGTGNAIDTDDQKTVEAGLTLASPDHDAWVQFMDYYGHEHGAGVNYADVLGSLRMTNTLKLVLNGDWYTRHSDPLAGGPVYAYGFAGYLDYTINKQWKTSLRGEYVKTRNIASIVNRAGNGKATLSEVTATLSYSPVKAVVLRGELRYDMGDTIYPDPGTTGNPHFADTQGNVAVEAIYKF